MNVLTRFAAILASLIALALPAAADITVRQDSGTGVVKHIVKFTSDHAINTISERIPACVSMTVYFDQSAATQVSLYEVDPDDDTFAEVEASTLVNAFTTTSKHASFSTTKSGLRFVVDTATTGGLPSVATLICSDIAGGGGGVLGEGPFASMPGSADYGSLWLQDDANGTNDCISGGGVADILCVYTDNDAWVPVPVAGAGDNLGTGTTNTPIDISAGVNNITLADTATVDGRDVSADGAKLDETNQNTVFVSDYDGNPGALNGLGPGGQDLPVFTASENATYGTLDLSDRIRHAFAAGCPDTGGESKGNCRLVLPEGDFIVDNTAQLWGCDDRFDTPATGGGRQTSVTTAPDGFCDFDGVTAQVNGAVMRNVTIESAMTARGFIQGATMGAVDGDCGTTILYKGDSGDTDQPMMVAHGTQNVTFGEGICFVMNGDQTGEAEGTEPATIGLWITANTESGRTESGKGSMVKGFQCRADANNYEDFNTYEATCVQYGHPGEEFAEQIDDIQIRDVNFSAHNCVILGNRGVGGTLVQNFHCETGGKGIWVEQQDLTLIGGTIVAMVGNDPTDTHEFTAWKNTDAAIYLGTDVAAALDQPWNVSLIGTRLEMDAGISVDTLVTSNPTMRETSFSIINSMVAHGYSCIDSFDDVGVPQTTGSADGFCDFDGVTPDGRPAIQYDLKGRFTVLGSIIGLRGGNFATADTFFQFDPVTNVNTTYFIDAANYITGAGFIAGTGGTGTVRKTVNADLLDLIDDYAWTGAHDFGGASLEIPNGTSLPGTCNIGDQFMDTDATSGQRHYLCESANTWVAQGGAGSGDITEIGLTDATPGTIACTTGACFEGTGTENNLTVTGDFIIKVDSDVNEVAEFKVLDGNNGEMFSMLEGGSMTSANFIASSTMGAPIINVGSAEGDGNLFLWDDDSAATTDSYYLLQAPDGLNAAGGFMPFVLPLTIGSATNVLTTDGAGNLSWGAGGAGPWTGVTAAIYPTETAVPQDFGIGWDGDGVLETDFSLFYDEALGDLHINVPGGSIDIEPAAATGSTLVFKEGSDNNGDADNDTITINAPAAVTEGGFSCTLDNDATPFDGCIDATLVDIADGTIAENLVNTANPWAVNEGGTGAATFTDGGILLGSGTGAITALGVATNGQIPIGDGTTDPVLATISGTTNEIEITNGAGTIQVGIPTSPTIAVDNMTGNLDLATGTIRGGIDVESGTTGTDSNPAGQWFLLTGAGTRTLPEITVSGQSICYYALTGAVITVDPHANDGIRMTNGVLGTDGVTVTSPATAGSFACFLSRDNGTTDEWIMLGTKGTWAVGT